jgi:hypothetical protein
MATSARTVMHPCRHAGQTGGMPNRRSAYGPYTLPSWVMTTRDLPRAGENVRFAGGDARREQR